jgi:dihydrofolate reductase
MGSVFVHVTMSLDGFIAGRDDAMGWVSQYGTDPMIDEVLAEIGAVVLGRRTFDIGLKNNQLPYGGVLQVPQLVVTHEHRDPQAIGALSFVFLDDLPRAINEGKRLAGEKAVALLGASIDQQALTAGLVDEVVIHVVPILLGEGIRLFDVPGTKPIKLERRMVVASAQITSMRLAVVREG